ncbi:kinesin [Corynebacterium accolens]|uniref:kinesin n=1 Tax=Corynebacterium accolens TaxID=38284 RepID=UPI002543AC18|nr:kinesin [Corynebacterium accolens]MDK4293300.1 kinesin [Corynebacterium accolens]WKS62194.1 kinesin [Corynebacterium accolens]WKS65426.1 kinesin [Corynebacterium accolens]WKS70065.1 kinesin [Corynebacterium accolens]WKS70393.1 kinesin [Corynebacterium accolens]
MAKETARALGHEVDVDREKFTYLASTDAEGNKIESGKAAAAGAGAAGAAAAGTAAAGAAATASADEQNDAAAQSDYEPKNHVVTGAEEEHVAAASEQPDLQEKLDEDNADYEPSQHVVGEAEEEHIAAAPEQPAEDAADEERDDFDDLKDKVTEAGNVVEEAINRAKDFVEDKAQEYQEGSGKKGGFFDRVKDVVREARDNLDEKRK